MMPCVYVCVFMYKLTKGRENKSIKLNPHVNLISFCIAGHFVSSF